MTGNIRLCCTTTTTTTTTTTSKDMSRSAATGCCQTISNAGGTATVQVLGLSRLGTATAIYQINTVIMFHDKLMRFLWLLFGFILHGRIFPEKCIAITTASGHLWRDSVVMMGHGKPYSTFHPCRWQEFRVGEN